MQTRTITRVTLKSSLRYVIQESTDASQAPDYHIIIKLHVLGGTDLLQLRQVGVARRNPKSSSAKLLGLEKLVKPESSCGASVSCLQKQHSSTLRRTLPQVAVLKAYEVVLVVFEAGGVQKVSQLTDLCVAFLQRYRFEAIFERAPVVAQLELRLGPISEDHGSQASSLSVLSQIGSLAIHAHGFLQVELSSRLHPSLQQIICLSLHKV